jgi:hypothetical protein
LQDENSLQREEEVEAAGLEDTSDSGGQNSEEEEDFEEEGNEEGEEGHDEGVGVTGLHQDPHSR